MVNVCKYPDNFNLIPYASLIWYYLHFFRYNIEVFILVEVQFSPIISNYIKIKNIKNIYLKSVYHDKSNNIPHDYIISYILEILFWGFSLHVGKILKTEFILPLSVNRFLYSLCLLIDFSHINLPRDIHIEGDNLLVVNTVNNI